MANTQAYFQCIMLKTKFSNLQLKERDLVVESFKELRNLMNQLKLILVR